MSEEVAEILGVVWDNANAAGLDGWIGPGRGAGEVDDEAIRIRERDLQKAEAKILDVCKPRTITTAEELDALPVDSVVRTSNGHVYEKGCFPDDEEFPFWAATGEPRVFPGRRVPLPAIVLWEPR